MKLAKPFIITTISLLLCTGCDSIFTVKRNNVFFTNSDLSKYLLKDLPSLEYESSHIEKNNKGLKGYFNVSKDTLDNYAEEIISYYRKDSFKYDYGMLLDNSYMFGIPNIFDALKTRRLVKTDHLNFFKLYNDRYAFFYEKDNQFYELLIKNENNTIEDKEYNFFLSIGKVKQVKWSSDHQAVSITNDNYDQYLSLDIDFPDNSPGYATINVVPKEYHFALADYYLEIDYTEKGNHDTHLFDGSNYHDVLLKSDDGSIYEEGDIIINSATIVKESALILELNNPVNNNQDN